MKLEPARRVASLERTLIRRIFDSAPRDAINLGLGQPDLPTPAVISLAGCAGIAAGKTAYTSTAGDPTLRAAIAESYAGFAAGAGNVVVTVGSQEAMYAVCLTLLDPGDELLYPDPGYPAYPVVADLLGARGVPYPLRAENGFRIRVEDVAERLGPRTRAVIVTEPSNPTGAFSDAAELERLAATLEQAGVPWIADEIYSGFAYDREFVSLSRVAPRGGVVVSGLSKDLSMTGWRVGWAVGPEPLIERMTAVHQYLLTCASSVSQAAALAAFTPAGRGEAARYLEIFRRRREVMAEELARIPHLRFALPDGAFYFFVDFSHYGDPVAVCGRILERRKVVVIPGAAFGRNATGHVRISFAASDADIREGVRRIATELG